VQAKIRQWFLAGIRPAQPFPAQLPVTGLVAFLAFVILAVLVLTGGTLKADDALELDVHAGDSAGLTALMGGLTTLGTIPVIVAVVAVVDLLLLFFRRRLEALLLTGAMVGEGAWDDLLKFSFRRPRPLLFPHPAIHSYSFPSGHAFATLCLLAILLDLLWRHLPAWGRLVVGIIAGLLALGIGLSRVYLGVHYPSDVVGGWLAALAWLGAVAALARRYLPLRLPGEE
jgi:undecaprenyl-diphosphatase